MKKFVSTTGMVVAATSLFSTTSYAEEQAPLQLATETTIYKETSTIADTSRIETETEIKKVTTSSFPNKMVVTADNVNIRRGAMTSYEVVSQVHSDQEVTIIHMVVNNKNETWYKIDTGDVQGWVISDFLTKVSSDDSNDSQEDDQSPIDERIGTIMRSNIDNTPVRRGALASYREVYLLSLDEKVEIINFFKNEFGQEWLKIKNEKAEGWVQASYLSPLLRGNETPKDDEQLDDNPHSNSLIGQKMAVQTEQASVHRGATSDYKIVGHLSINQVVTVTDVFMNQNKETWLKVKNGQLEGWVHENNLAKVGVSIPINTEMYVKADLAFIRRGATENYVVTAAFVRNEKVNVIEKIFNNEGELWYRVQLPSGKKGWVPANQLSNEPGLNKTVYISASAGNVRKGAMTHYDVVASLSKGTALKAIDQFENDNGELWYRVIVNENFEGWVSSSIVSTEMIPINQTKTVGTRNAVVYRGAAFNYRITTKVSYGTRVTVLYEFINEYNQKWLKVRTPSGATGWIPGWELYSNLSDRKFVYAIESDAIRRGAANHYSKVADIPRGTPLIKLWSYGEWINVETLNGQRGWMKEEKTANVVPKMLITPTLSSDKSGAKLISWKKSQNFDLSYNMLSNNVLKITGNFTSADLPTFSVQGISNFKVDQNNLYLTFNPNYTFTIRNYDDSLSVKVLPIGVAGKKIIVDAGHGGHDSGARGASGLLEKDVNLSVAKYLKAELEAKGATVMLTRLSDIFLELSERTDIANQSDYDAFISIHANASVSPSANGTETYFDIDYNFNGPKSVEMAKAVQQALFREIGTNNRGVKDQNFYVNRNNSLPSILVELGFLTNPAEESLLRRDESRRKAAIGIRKGLENYFNRF